jgi:ABC-type multidrug transport system ATPase subunit
MTPEIRVVGAPAAPPNRPRLSVEGMTKSFNGRPAIEDVSFTVDEHEFVAVLGQSSAGKTTLFRCVAGLLPPDQASPGSVAIASRRCAAGIDAASQWSFSSSTW